MCIRDSTTADGAAYLDRVVAALPQAFTGLHVVARGTINPVSYTHLDVYKRQPTRGGETEGQEMPNEVADVIVVGAGNAAFCAALAAQEQGAKVVMLEAASENESGGNSRFTAGSIRVVYNLSLIHI